MVSAGCTPDTYTYSPFIEYLCKMKGSQEGLSFIDEMLKKSVKLTTVNYTIVIDKLFKERNYGLATKIWGQMVSLGCNPDAVTYTTSMRAYCNEGRLIEAENVVSEMNRSAVTVDTIAYNTLMDGHASIGQTDCAVSILKHMKNVASMPNQFTYLILLRHLVQRRLAEGVPLNVAGLWKTTRLTDIFELFEIMKKNDIIPNTDTYSAILERFSEDGISKEVTSLVSRIKDDNLSLNEDIYTALITCLCKSRQYSDAWALLHSMIGRGFVPQLMSYQHLLCGLISEGQAHMAEEIFGNGRWEDYNPDEIVWKVIIDGLIRNGHSDICRDMVSKLEQRNCRPSNQTYVMLAEELSTRG
ncbi:pentatricopeptide repeat-containing protein At5g65560-like [Triticum urartu]|uniref:Pentatricopeptide repeat-containing protein n=2 Tax=Triticum TaxID=4564 RepID=A0A8R7QPB3_TRIUA|nr:pentatricopeptide repeat-containing protein At5g65560-like [Triticum urartu]XP_048534400.1 pentatricopeptide repeat-containing protein At5g65560-like [Triticum urartu]XP_048534401.1 pentatricopeptide repeat-containing protein At5g65560-like [Triticum urartu]XP_048534402.1 pentatricopeptide repeat-containing protein At5g65560-like [Triticum urartu]XP_048534403.1 pentatricopeptide repeat-containing protein At5g65560-like [Triticum urartu]XP_048534404.1 pentatricopeptide repeat-containing prot